MMAVNYIIRAEVVDIRSDNPIQDDVFLVDTNIWYWLTYTRASQTASRYQITDYPVYISKAVSAKSKLFRCGLLFIELASLIEKTEREIFERAKGCHVGAKEFRHNYTPERCNVVAEIQASWGQIKTIAFPFDLLLDESTTETILNKIGFQSIGGYDLLLLESSAKVGLLQIITDDGDFATIQDIRVFTANNNVIQKARNMGKLVVRNNS